MARVDALLRRVQRLELARAAPRTPFEVAYGSLDAFAAQVRADVESGKLDRRDMVGEDGDGGILRAILGWHEQGVYEMWTPGRRWEFAG